MSSAHIAIADAKVSVGWKCFQFRFHDFASIRSTKGYFIESPEFSCNGHRWQLRVYPGGNKDAVEGYVSASLHHLSDGRIKTKFCIGTYTYTCSYGSKETYKTGTLDNEFTRISQSWVCTEFIDHKTLTRDKSSFLLDNSGALTMVVSMALEEEPATVFVPENSALKMLKEMFNDIATADVCFQVGDCAGRTKGGKEKLKSSVSFHAHSLILRKFAPVLADLLGGSNTVTITDTKPAVFHHLLYYVYGGEVPKEELQSNAKAIIDAADKYAVVNLKMKAEAAYVEATNLTVDNAIDNLLYADGKNCALLKEKVMTFLTDHPKEVAEKISFADCPSHLMKDLLFAVGRKDRNDWNTAADDANELSTLSVSSLRSKLYELGLEVDIDGSRETMIEIIKKNNTTSTSS